MHQPRGRLGSQNLYDRSRSWTDAQLAQRLKNRVIRFSAPVGLDALPSTDTNGRHFDRRLALKLVYQGGLSDTLLARDKYHLALAP